MRKSSSVLSPAPETPLPPGTVHRSAVVEAVRICGGRDHLARALHVHYSSVNRWLMPTNYTPKVEGVAAGLFQAVHHKSPGGNVSLTAIEHPETLTALELLVSLLLHLLPPHRQVELFPHINDHGKLLKSAREVTDLVVSAAAGPVLAPFVRRVAARASKRRPVPANTRSRRPSRGRARRSKGSKARR